MHKTDAFFAVAKACNAIGITPLLYGSVGLELLLRTDLQADDIDILISEIYLDTQWHSVVSMMQSLGYALYDLQEHAFRKDDIRIAFAPIEDLSAFANVHICKKHLKTENGVQFYLMTLTDYLWVYTASAKDGYRKTNKHKNDQAKIDRIQHALEEEHYVE